MSLFDRQTARLASASAENQRITNRIHTVHLDILRLTRSTQFYKRTEQQLSPQHGLVQNRKPTTASCVTSPIYRAMNREQVRHLDRPMTVKERIRKLVIPLW
jgi:hypothetical protein